MVNETLTHPRGGGFAGRTQASGHARSPRGFRDLTPNRNYPSARYKDTASPNALAKLCLSRHFCSVLADSLVHAGRISAL